MPMTYVRTYKLTYEPTVDYDDRPRLNTLLFKNNLRSCSGYSTTVEDEYYGETIEISEKSTWILSMMGVDNALEFTYSSDADKAKEQLETAFPDEVIRITTQTVKTEKEVEQTARGNYLVAMDWHPYDLTVTPCMILGDNLTVRVELQTDWRSTKLTFTTTWITESVARKAAIEKNCVELPLEIMGKVQADVEHCLMRIGFTSSEIDEAIIDCHFDAKSESRSECTPDIIERVREAKRKAIEGEEE